MKTWFIFSREGASAGGKWTRASADVSEANGTLRRFLVEAGVRQEQADRVGTHGCKATALSWCAKAGVKSEHRRLLGGHARPKERQVLEYSRDSLAAPLLELERIFASIRVGLLRP